MIEWRAEIGDRVEHSQIVVLIESEKAEVEIEAPRAGFLRHIYIEPGSTVPCGTLLAALADTADEKFDAEAFRRATERVVAKPVPKPAEQTGNQLIGYSEEVILRLPGARQSIDHEVLEEEAVFEALLDLFQRHGRCRNRTVGQNQLVPDHLKERLGGGGEGDGGSLVVGHVDAEDDQIRCQSGTEALVLEEHLIDAVAGHAHVEYLDIAARVGGSEPPLQQLRKWPRGAVVVVGACREGERDTVAEGH